MQKPDYFVGLDIASATFTATVGRMGEQWQVVVRPVAFLNAYDSFAPFLHWLQAHGLPPDTCVLCMEATGVYGEVLAHFLVAHGYRLAIEPPLKVKRSFAPEGHKSDPVDSGQIAEYAYRFWDELSWWQPRSQVLEQIKTLLAVREQFVADSTAHQNGLRALQRKAVRTPLAEATHQTAITQLKGHIHSLEQEIQRLIDQDPTFHQTVLLLMSIPGVGLLLAAHLLVTLQRTPQPLSPKVLAAFIGICPYQHSSGASVHHPPTSRHYGPPGLRRLLFLAALSVRTHNPHFKHYFLRKTLEGKPPQLVINNIANKLLKIICAVVRSNTPYIRNYRSVNPVLLRTALTRS